MNKYPVDLNEFDSWHVIYIVEIDDGRLSYKHVGYGGDGSFCASDGDIILSKTIQGSGSYVGHIHYDIRHIHYDIQRLCRLTNGKLEDIVGEERQVFEDLLNVGV